MKKYLFIAYCVSLLLVSQCGEIWASSEPVTISLWTEDVPIQRTIFHEWVADFQEEYPWVTVDHQAFNNELWEENLRTAMYSKDPPDFFITESRAELLEYVKAGLVYDLTEWYNTYSDRFIPGYEINSVIHGRRYAIPWTVHVLDLIWYNPQIMQRHQLDPTTISTWEDLSTMCEMLKQHGEIPFAFGGGGAGWTGGHWVMFLLQKNLAPEAILRLVRREKHWTDPDVVAALSHFEEFHKKGYFAPQAAQHDRDAGRKLYFQGQGAFWQAGSWHLYQKGLDYVPQEWQFTFIPFPNFSQSPVQDIAISSSTSQWVVHKKSQHLDEALLFLEYVTRKAAAELWVKEAHGAVAARGSVNERTAEPEMIAIARYLEATNVVTGLENYLPRQVVQDGHWKGAARVLGGEIRTREWAELIEELHEAAGALQLD